MKDSFILYTEQKAVIDKLTDEQAGKLIKAIYEYVATGTTPQLDMTIDLVITPFITTLDKNKEKYEATCKKTGLTDGSHCSKCGDILIPQTETPISTTNHNYKDGRCSWCYEKDPSFKTPDIILGEYVEANGTKQSNGQYVISWEDEGESMATMTQIIWNPTEKSLIFAQVSASSISVTTAGIIYEHGASKQKITVINDQTATGLTSYKITGIGYIYPNTYTISNNSIYSYQCDASSTSLKNANKSLAESAITVLVAEIDRWLERNTDFDISDFGFTSW